MTKSHFLDGVWRNGEGKEFSSSDPATEEIVWTGREGLANEIDAAVAAAHRAYTSFSELEFKTRADYTRAYAEALASRKDEMADAISRETGKPLWEALEEVATMQAKVPVSIEAYQDRTGIQRIELGEFTGEKRYKPHGVVAVLGPFNLPGHLPHSHIVPALLAGNTVVFKPSEQTPLVAQKIMEVWETVGLPPGVFNMVQGGRSTGEALAAHPRLNGLFFTGSHAGGLALNRLFAEHPEKILALEMGGNNALIAWEVKDMAAGITALLQSAFITSGQRCVCARRLIVPEGKVGDKWLDLLVAGARRLRVGLHTDRPEPFMGPLISAAAADRLLEARDRLLQKGARTLLAMERSPRCLALLSPGILDVTSVPELPDGEYFGPLLQVIRAPDFATALDLANATRFGLAAGLLDDSRERFEQFFRKIRAGVVNWNRPITGASGKLPFGGIGQSGNHRPSAYAAADYCAYPVASLQSESVTRPANLPPGLEG